MGVSSGSGAGPWVEEYRVWDEGGVVVTLVSWLRTDRPRHRTTNPKVLFRERRADCTNVFGVTRTGGGDPGGRRAGKGGLRETRREDGGEDKNNRLSV